MATISERGLRLIKNAEGLRLASYQDAVGVWTIGYGHTGPLVRQGQEITEAEAETLLLTDLWRFEEGVENALARPATQGQFDAMVSLAFNIGLGAFRESTLLEKFNAGDVAGAEAEFGRWTHAGAQTLPGLVTRRAAEAALFAGDGA